MASKSPPEYNKAYRLAKSQDPEWVEKERKRQRELKARWREKNREEHNQRQRDYTAKKKQDPEWVEKERLRCIGKYYAKEDKSGYAAAAAKRRTAKLNRTPAWLTDFDKEMIEWTYYCAKMATEKFGEPYHVDHIIPLQGENVSGLHVPSNLRVISAKENLSKGNSYDA